MWIEALLALATLALLALAGLGLRTIRRLNRRIVDLQAALSAAEARGREQAERLSALAAWRDNQELVEHTVESGTSMVRAVHRGIADIPFAILEAIPPTAPTTRMVRQMHDAISDGIYGAISQLNKAVGRELRKGMGNDAPARATKPSRSDEPPPRPDTPEDPD